MLNYFKLLVMKSELTEEQISFHQENGYIISFMIIIFLLFSHLSQAQDDSGVKTILEKDLTFSFVPNGFVHEVKLPSNLNLPSFLGISAVVANNGDDVFRLEGFLNNDPWITSCIYLEPGEIKTLQIIMQRQREKGANLFSNMHGLPGGTVRLYSPIRPENIDRITFKVFTKKNASLTISDIKPYGEFTSPQKIAETPGFFPFLDKLGQYKQADWPGKIKNELELKQVITTEDALLAAMPGPIGRNQYGGWADGPKLKATGNFRTEKVNGKWWLVDPEGCLFWSIGITCVRFDNAATQISGRKKFFEGLPGFTDSMAMFYSLGRDTSFNFTEANLYRKYGTQWKAEATANVFKRLKSWGINSFGNWSDPELYLSDENHMPYTVAVTPNWPKLDGVKAKFPNVFDPAFRASVKLALSRLDVRVKNDPYCIGYFIDNELDVKDLTQKLMMQPANSTAKQAFLDYLKAKYASVEALNEKWKTSFTTWQQIDSVSAVPEGGSEDYKDFDLKIVDLYYKTCSEELKMAAPDKIYFGSRLHCHYFPDDQTESGIIKIAAKYCDVVCFNRYRFSAEDLILPFGIDKPTIIGEFHFGALDRGLSHPSVRGVANQDQRAEAYYRYIESALNNPQIVGAHWFQYGDQAVTGRFDGENYQLGFVDICDKPYPEITGAARKIAYPMYKIRYGE
jgi:hypothetical protein